MTTMGRPVAKLTFEQAHGFWIENGTRCVIPPVAFRNIPGYRRVLRVLKEDGDLEPEDKRNTKKVPSAICHPREHCRGHFIRVTRDDL